VTAQADKTTRDEKEAAFAPSLLGRFSRSLAGRLLALTVGFVLLAEALIFAPSIGDRLRVSLQDRVDAAQIAALALEAAPAQAVDERLERELLANADVYLVALKRDGARVLQMARPFPLDPPLEAIDLRAMNDVQAIGLAMHTLFAGHSRYFRVIAAPRLGSGEYIEVVTAETGLRRELAAQARAIVRSSLTISVITAALVYFTLLALFVRPMRRLTKHIELFSARPADASVTIKPSGRSDEIGRAEIALKQMEDQVRASLRQRERLAGLGEAVAKIAHDLRSGLATASLLTERLAASADPNARQIAPRLERAIERAVNLAQAALKFGKADEAPADLKPLSIRSALADAAEEALAAFPKIAWTNAAEDIAVTADDDQLHRILTNLIRNAAQALTAQAGRAAPGSIAATANAFGGRVLIRIVDDGPGLPEAVQARLFVPFQAGGPTGVGLGLAIARELARAQGGDLALVTTGPDGTAFELNLPVG
jgi:signal transduction histidine kinase